MTQFKSVASQVPSLVSDFESSLNSVVSSCRSGKASESQISALSDRGEKLFETANMKIMALAGITDGSPISSAAESVASTTRLLVRVNLRALLTAARNGDGSKVSSLASKAEPLIKKIYDSCAEVQNL